MSIQKTMFYLNKSRYWKNSASSVETSNMSLYSYISEKIFRFLENIWIRDLQKKTNNVNNILRDIKISLKNLLVTYNWKEKTLVIN